MTTPACPSYAGYRFPAEIISHAVWLYFRFPLSLRMVDELLAARGIIVSYETVRQWARKFGQSFANQIRRRLPVAGDKWHMDEVVLTISGVKHWLWRAVDQTGTVLDILVQSRRDTQAAKRLLRKLLKRQCRPPRVMITDLRTCLSGSFAPRSHFYSQEITSIRLVGRMGAEMWTEAHRARHEAGLKEMVSTCAVEEMARWLERADPPHSEKATPVLPVVSAIAWHLRVGGPWRALPGDFPVWRTVYGWFRRWLDLGLFDRLLCDVARLRRRAAGRTPEPSLGIIDTQSVKCIPVRGPRGYDAAKKVLGRKRVALVDADGTWLAIAVVPASTQERDTLPDHPPF